MGQVPGAEKEFFLIRGRGRPTVYGGRASGILSIRGPEVSRGSPRVDTIHVQSPTPYAPPLPAYFGQFSHQCGPLNHQLLGNGFQSSRRAPRIGACGPGDDPTSDLSHRASESRSASKKSK